MSASATSSAPGPSCSPPSRAAASPAQTHAKEEAVDETANPTPDVSRTSSAHKSPWNHATATATSAPEMQGPAAYSSKQSAHRGSLEVVGLWVYPVKSAAGMQVEEWPLGPNGLLYDREWIIAGPTGMPLGRRRHPRLYSLRPSVDLSAGTLTLTSPWMETALVIDISPSGGWCRGSADTISVKLSGQQVKADTGADLSSSDWLSDAVDHPCSIVRQRQGERRVRTRTSSGGGTLGFANEGQLLLIHAASLADLQRRVQAATMAEVNNGLVSHIGDASSSKDSGAASVAVAVAAAAKAEDLTNVARFRPNVLVSTPNGVRSTAFAEDEWTTILMGPHKFHVAGPCARCDVVCHDPVTGALNSSQPLLALATFRRVRGAINFGVLLDCPQPADALMQGLWCHTAQSIPEDIDPRESNSEKAALEDSKSDSPSQTAVLPPAGVHASDMPSCSADTAYGQSTQPGQTRSSMTLSVGMSVYGTKR